MAESRLESISTSSIVSSGLNSASKFLVALVDLTEAGVAFWSGKPPETFT